MSAVRIPYVSRADDLVLLELLDARDRCGLRGAALCRHMAGITGTPWSNSRLQGALSRLRADDIPCTCRKPEKRDGGMPERWWAA